MALPDALLVHCVSSTYTVNMFCKYIIMFVAVALSRGEEQNNRPARNPALLHLTHAGQSVGSYVGSARGAGGGGGGGARIVIVGGQPAHVSTHVASKDSLEELDDELRQHYSAQQGQGYRSVNGGPTYRTGPAFNFLGGHPGYSPIAVVGHPLAGYAGGATGQAPHYFTGSVTASPTPSYPVASHQVASSGQHSGTGSSSPTPASVNYSPPSHYSATPTPLVHTPVTPVVHSVIPARLPFHTGPAPAFQGIRYSPHVGQSPVFIPIQAVGQQQQFQGHGYTLARVPAAYAPAYGAGGSRPQASYDDFKSNDDEKARFVEKYEERSPLNHYQSQSHQREYESAERQQPAYPVESTQYDESYKFGSNDGFGKSSADTSAFFRKFPSLSDDKGSFEDNGSHEASEERGNQGVFKYSFADDHSGTPGRSYHGEDKVATSYQSVTLETQHHVPNYYSQKHQ